MQNNEYLNYQCVECEIFEICQECGDTFADDAACELFQKVDYLKNDGPANWEINK